MSLPRMLKYSFFVKDKFIDVLQLFVISDFTFTSIQIIHYFSCVMKICLLLSSKTKIKYPSLISSSANLSSAICAFSFLLTSTCHHYSILHMESLRAPFQSCQQSSTCSSLFSSEVFSLNISFYLFGSLLFTFSPLLCLLETSFFLSFFHRFF